MKIYNLKLMIFKSICVILGIVLNLIIYLRTKDGYLTLITLIVTLLMISLNFLYDKILKNYMAFILENLSDMLDTIISMKEKETFSTVDDTIFSKLQNQINKLTNILISQNKRIEEEKNQIKMLISDISHQLKTPISNITLYSEFLKDEDLTKEERLEFNNIVILSINKLTFLVESMIKMSRLESGVISLKFKEGSLNETVLLSLNQVYKKAEKKNITISLEEKSNIKINQDKNWLSEAIFNVLENAIKYTERGGRINITLSSYEVFSRIDIEDNGIGISEEEFPKIFSRFYRGTNSYEVEGIGIGLYLTREIITKHNGYIKVSSNEEGSKFSIFLPR